MDVFSFETRVDRGERSGSLVRHHIAVITTGLALENHMEKIGTFTFRKMDEASARQIVFWQYDPPYDIYNINCAASEAVANVQWFLKPVNS